MRDSSASAPGPSRQSEDDAAPRAVGPASGEIRQGTLPDSEIGSLVETMRGGEPWRVALARLPLPELQRKPYWFTDAEKARFYRDLPVAERGHALDIGAGSGVIAAALASDFRQVVALEHDRVWCEFMERRFHEDGLSNVLVRNAGAPPVPYPADSFDLVVVNGVLEWVPESAPLTQSPREAQVAFLREVRRVLRPGGAVGVAIENRMFIENFLGGAPHGETPFVVILPRPLADLIHRRRTGRPYRTWIYGPAGYSALFRAAGFSGVEINQVLPSYHEPRRVVALEDAQAAYESLGGRNPLKRTFLEVGRRLGFLGRFVHSFYLSARK